MNILLITIFFVAFMVSEIPRVSVFGYCPYCVTFPSYANRGKPKSISVLLLEPGCMNNNHVA